MRKARWDLAGWLSAARGGRGVRRGGSGRAAWRALLCGEVDREDRRSNVDRQQDASRRGHAGARPRARHGSVGDPHAGAESAFLPNVRGSYQATRLSRSATAQSAGDGAPHMNSRSRQAAFARDMARWLDAPAALRYGMAAVLAVVALLAKYALLAAGLDSFFLLIIPAVLVAALLGGVGPGLLATSITGLVTY